MNRVINWWIKGVLLAGMMMLAGMAEAVDVSSAEGLASANGFKGKANWSGNKVTLTGNVELTETITIKADGDIVLELNEHNIYNIWKLGNRNKIDIFDIEKGTLTIQGNGSVYNQGTDGNSTIWVNGGTLNVKANIYSEKYAAITITGGCVNIFSGDISSEGSKETLEVQGGTININGGTIRNERSINSSVALKIVGGALNVFDGYIYAKSGTISAHALEKKGGNVQIKGGKFGASCATGERAIDSDVEFSKIFVPGYGINGSDADNSKTSIKGTVEIKPITYNVTYFDGETEITSGITPTEYTVETLPFSLKTLSKEHYNFAHWHYGERNVDKNIVENTTIQDTTGHLSFTAHFTPIEYSIIYERNGGQKESNNPDTYTVETVFTFERPIKPFYKFEGWFDNKNFSGSQITELNKDFYGNPLRLYAKWSPEPYEVDFYDGDTKYQIYDNYTRDIEKGISVLPKPEKQDRVFTGWKQKNGTLVESVSPGTESLNLYASWKLIEFTIQYDPQGGEMSTQSIQYTSDKTGELTWLAGESVWKEGFAFKGWFLNKECQGERITTFPIDKKMGTTSLTDESKVTIRLYAKWEEANYDILFLPRGGSAVHSEEYSLEKGVKESEMPETERRGWEFLGWFNQPEGGTKYTSIAAQPGPDKEKITLYAHWKAYDYKLTYVVNGGTLPADAKKTYTVAEVVTLPEPKKEHYDFVGWFTANEEGTKYMENVFYYETGDKTLYARWTPKIYHLSYVTNGGSEIKGSFPFTYGQPIEIDKRTYKTNYDFEGWFVDAGFTKPYNKNTSGSIGGDLTLYAKWGPKHYKIHYDMFHGEELPDDTYTTEESKQLPTNAIRPGFTFAGWYADDMLTVGPVTKIEKGESGDKTFYATWKPGYMVRFTQPENGKIEVKRRGDLLVSGDKVGEGVEITITATPTDTKYGLKALSIGGKTYTTSPQIIKMPANDLYISAIFEDARTVASAPEIITDPENTDNMLTGTVVKVTLKKTDENTTLYYSISDSPKRLYEEPFEVSTDAKQLITLKAFAVKEGYKDGVTVRDMGFGVKKLLVTFDLPAGITAINPLGGEVVSAIASGGAFEFSLEVDRNYFQSLDSMTVLANDSVLTANANGIYRVEGASKDVKITVKGLESVTYTVTLVQATKGGYIHFTEDGSDGSLTLPCSKQISVTAVPDLNYKFGGWKNGSQANPGIFTITSDTTLEAVFVPNAKYFTITLPVLEGVAVKPLSGYSTEVLQGDKFHFYLRFADGYHGENLIVKANGVELTANEEGVYSLYRIVGNYSISLEGVVKDSVKLKLAEHVSAVDIATATDAMKARLYPESMISLLATAPDGQYFYKWNDGNSDNPRIVTVREASGLLPLFQPRSGKGNYAKIQLPNVVGAGVGVQVDVHSVEVGGKMPFKVVLLPGYSQSEVKVTANGKLLEEGLSMRAASKSHTLVYSLTNVEKEVKIEIDGLKLDTYEVECLMPEGGRASVSPSGKVKYGSRVTFLATPDPGNIFVKWDDGNTLNPYPYAVNGDVSLQAVFMRRDMAVANENIHLSAIRMYVLSGRLYVETAEDTFLRVWELSGRMLLEKRIPEGCSSHALPEGCYLIKVGNTVTQKIIIR
ncbi:InlB B-repeat-containing protein [Parabacteroides gordonii]|uniref:InlB B-repeat-containing protein n=1 Tax=Parabacteroides gordonii TaxID=574930 RepID=UPI00241F19CD|nr:InlB B-repeat-containing protein [Parabacteroides gordonii]